MPATVVQDWASATTGTTASPANATVQLSGTGTPATAGNLLLVAVNSDATVATPSGYTLIASSIHNAGCYLYGKVAAGGETGVTVTPNVAASTSVAIAEIGNLSGATVANILDKTASNGTGTGQNTRSTGTTAGTVQADEYAVAVWGYSANTASFPADFGSGGNNKWSAQTNSFTEKIDVGTTKSSATNVGLCIAVKDLSSTGTVESTATVINSNSIPAESLLATFKALSGSTPKTLSDAGAAADDLTLTATGTLDEAGSGADALSLSAAVTASDTGSAADALTVSRTVALSDTGLAADTLTATAAVPLADAAAGAQTLTAAAALMLTEAGSGTDAPAITAVAPLADAGSATDAVDNGTGTSKPVADTAGSTQALSVGAVLTLAETGAAADALTVSTAVTLAQSGAGADTLTAGASIALADTGSATQTLAVTAALALADAGVAGDGATGQDDASASKPLTDAGSAADQLTFVHSLIVGNPTVTGSDVLAGVTGDASTAGVAGDERPATVT